MAIIELSGMQIETDNILSVEPANLPGRTNIMLKDPPSGSVTVPLDHKEVLERIAQTR